MYTLTKMVWQQLQGPLSQYQIFLTFIKFTETSSTYNSTSKIFWSGIYNEIRETSVLITNANFTNSFMHEGLPVLEGFWNDQGHVTLQLAGKFL